MTTKVTLSIKNVACVHVTNRYRRFNVDRKKISQIVTEVSRRLGIAQYEICVQFVSPAAMRRLNKQYRKQDKTTDVLSFPQCEWKRPLKVQKDPAPTVKIMNPLPLGDVVISPADATLNARDSGHELAKEICFLMVHGILHLVGHDHMKPGERRRMFAEQTKLMRLFSGGRSGRPVWTGCVKKSKTAESGKRSVRSTKHLHTRKRKN